MRGFNPQFRSPINEVNMSDLGNIANTEEETKQPVNVVATEAEEITQPQGDDGEVELYVETEGDQEQPKTNMSREQAYAAFRKEKEKRQRKNEELEASKKREQELAERIAKLESSIGSIKKGAPPTLESFDYDEDKYAQAVKEYYAPSQPEKAEAKQEIANESNQSPVLNDEAEFYLYEKEQELIKQIPDYESDKAQLVEKFKQFGGGEHNLNEMAQIANQTGVDIAKANLAFNRNPALLNKLVNAYPRGPFAVADVLKEAESKVQTRQRKPIDTQPEPNINSSGPIDNKASAIAKAREAWMNAEPQHQARLWKEYQAAKKP